MTTPPTSQTNPLDPVFSGVPVIIPQGNLVNPTWNKWFVDLREKVNVINSTLAAWSGITPVTGLTPGTYGDATHYPIVTINQYGMITDISTQFVSGGGNPIHITTVTANVTVALSNVPNASANKGLIVVNSGSTTTVSIDVFANTNIPVGTDLIVFQQGAGATSFFGLTGVTLQGPTITGGGLGASGHAIQISTDVWMISGNISYSSGGDPYWSDVISLLPFNGSSGSTTFTDAAGKSTWSNASSTAAISTVKSKWNGSSLFLDGSAGYLTAATPANLDVSNVDFTIEAWVYVVSTVNIGVIFASWKSSSDMSLRVLVNSGGAIQLAYSVGGSGANSFNAGNISTGAWHHLAICNKALNTAAYIDGVSVASGTLPATIDTGGYAVEIGRNLQNASWFFDGYINDFRLTKGICRYTANFTPPTAPFPTN